MANRIERYSFQKTEGTVTNARGGNEFVIQFVDFAHGENDRVGLLRARRIRVTFRTGSGTATVQSEYWKDGWVEVFGPRQFTGLASSAMRLSKLDKDAENEEFRVLEFLEGA